MGFERVTRSVSRRLGVGVLVPPMQSNRAIQAGLAATHDAPCQI